jgi:hypothetical protein
MTRQIRRHAAFLIAALFLLLAAGGALAQMSVEVIALKYRTAEEVIPMLQPMIASGGSLSGLRGQLVVRTTQANLAELRRVLASVDAAPRRLLISVAQDTAYDASRRGAEISGSLRAEDNLRLTIPGSTGAPRDGVQARVYDSRSVDNVRVTQTVQVLEGRSAFIQSGAEVAVPQRRVVRSVVNGRVVDQLVDDVQYRSADTGFEVTPRLSGDIVTLDVSPRREAFVQGARGAVDVQRVVSTVSGRLGEWIELAAVSQERTSEREVILGRAGRTRTESRSVLVKVEELR